MKTKMSFPNEIEKVKAEIKVLEKKLSFLEELSQTKSPVEEAFKDWMGVYPPTNPSVDNIFDIRWRAFQKGYDAAYEEKVAQEPEENKWKSVALRFGEKLSGYLSDNYYELSPSAWFRWAVVTYGKNQDIKDAVRESVKWCEENPDKDPLDCLKPQTEKEVKKLQEKDWEIKVETDYLTGKARHKTKIVDKDGNDYQPKPHTTEELLKPNWEPKSQTEEQVADGLKEAFREAVKQGVVSSVDKQENDRNFKNSLDLIKEWGEKNKSKTLYQICMEWWNEVFVNQMDDDICVDVLVSKIDKEFIPPSHDTNDYQWNKCLKIMRDKLR
jgi:hypothetical protein